MSTIQHQLAAYKKIIQICEQIEMRLQALKVTSEHLPAVRKQMQRNIDKLYAELSEAKKEAANYDIEGEVVTGIIVERNDMVTMAEHFQFWPDNSF